MVEEVEVDEAAAGADSEVVVEVDSVVGEEEVASVVDPEEAVDLEVGEDDCERMSCKVVIYPVYKTMQVPLNAIYTP